MWKSDDVDKEVLEAVNLLHNFLSIFHFINLAIIPYR